MNSKVQFKPCCVCNCKPRDIGDVTMGEYDENNKGWYCFDCVDILWKRAEKKYGCKINTTSDWWSLLAKIGKTCPRPS